MTIPTTKMHDQINEFRLVDQRRTLLINLQSAIPSNAATHQKMLLSGSSVDQVKGFVQDCQKKYAELLNMALVIGPDNAQSLSDGMLKAGLAESDFTDVIVALSAEVQKLGTAKLDTAQDINAACGELIANVNVPVLGPAKSLWPE